MWQVLNVEPAYGVCSLCRSHECGIVDGQHQWIHCEALDDSRENIVIGYNCVKIFAENLGINKEVVEKVVEVPPTDDQLLNLIKQQLGFRDELHGSLSIDDHRRIFGTDLHLTPSEVQQASEPKTSARKRIK